MGKVLGIGGVFFKCHNKERLAQWYADNLQFDLNKYGGNEFKFDAVPENSFCMWGPFSEDTEYFAPSTKNFMINLIVDNVELVLAKAKKGGATTIGKIDEHEFGRFAWFLDPEGNKIELWQPHKEQSPQL